MSYIDQKFFLFKYMYLIFIEIWWGHHIQAQSILMGAKAQQMKSIT